MLCVRVWHLGVVVVDDHPEVAVEEGTSLFDADNGFQEVRNKKTTKDTKKEELGSKGGRGKSQPQGQPSQSSSQPQPGQQPSQQPTPLMSINAQPPSKQNFERSRPCKLPPRLAKQRENNRLQKQQAAAAQQQDVNEMNKVNQNISMYPMKGRQYFYQQMERLAINCL